MTKIEALEGTVELWEWLAGNPGKIKEDWPGWRNYKHVSYHCFACEYDKQEQESHQKTYCNKTCIIPCFSNAADSGDDFHCYFDSSPYVKWINCFSNDIKESTEYAQSIADSGREALKKGELENE